MALIVEYHVIADMYPIAASTQIKAGMLVTLGSTGLAGVATDVAGVIGIAGDTSYGTEAQTTAYSAQVVIGAVDSDTAATRFTSNRVSDFYDETTASNKITVYNGGGKFWTDQFTAGASSAAVGAVLHSSAAGLLDSAGSNVVAVKAGLSKLYPSGVPGTEVDGSLAIANEQSDDYWLPIVLRI